MRGGTCLEYAILLVLLGLTLTGVTLAFEEKIVVMRRVNPGGFP